MLLGFALINEHDTKEPMRIFVLSLVFIMLSVSTGLSRQKVPPRLVQHQLARAEVLQILDGGPQRFIASLRVEPAFQGKRFLGYRLLGFTADSPLARSTAIATGDIVVAVNGESLERPEQFMSVWKAVREKASLELLLIRGSERILYRWALTP